MKKKIALILSVMLLLLAFAACADDGKASESTFSTSSAASDVSGAPAEEPVTIRVAGLKGPTSIGLIRVMEAADNGTAANDYVFTVAGSADEVTPGLIRGEIDIAAIPSNLASVLYNNTDGEIQVIAVNTLGVLYIVDKGGEVATLDDLRGKTIYATGKGSTPEYTLRHILEKNGIDPDNDVTIDFKSEPTEVVALLNGSDAGVAMLPQPYVTVAENNVDGLTTVIDLNEEWGKIEGETGIITGVAVVRKAFADEHPEAVKRFLDEYADSVEYVNANVEAASELVEKYGIVAAAIAKKAIPKCNVTFVSGDDMKEALNVYLGVLYEANPQSVGGSVPGDDFFRTFE